MQSKESARGFASMDRERLRQIASKGGRAAHSLGRAYAFTSELARDAGRKGGLAVSRDRAHMARIGRQGGHAVSRDRAHMAEIGKMGGTLVSQDRKHMADIGREGGLAISEDRVHMANIGRQRNQQRHAARNPKPTSCSAEPVAPSK